MFCVMPGKGACGATTLASNLAFHLQRIATVKKKVLLADLDPDRRHLSRLLLEDEVELQSFVDALSHSSQMDEDLWRALVTHQQGVDVILSPENPVEKIQTNEAAAMIEYSRENYSAVILDAASPYGEWQENIAKLCDELILVTTNELPALHATQRAIAHLERVGIERSKIRLVVNRFNGDLGLDRDAIQTALDLDIFYVLPNDGDTIQKSASWRESPWPRTAASASRSSPWRDWLGGRGEPAKRSSPFSQVSSISSKAYYREASITRA